MTYEGMAAYWPSASGAVAEVMNDVPKVVFSRTLAKADWNNTRVVRENAEAEVAKLKSASGTRSFLETLGLAEPAAA